MAPQRFTRSRLSLSFGFLWVPKWRNCRKNRPQIWFGVEESGVQREFRSPLMRNHEVCGEKNAISHRIKQPLRLTKSLLYLPCRSFSALHCDMTLNADTHAPFFLVSHFDSEMISQVKALSATLEDVVPICFHQLTPSLDIKDVQTIRQVMLRLHQGEFVETIGFSASTAVFVEPGSVHSRKVLVADLTFGEDGHYLTIFLCPLSEAATWCVASSLKPGILFESVGDPDTLILHRDAVLFKHAFQA